MEFEVFLSYSSVDVAIAERFERELSSVNFRVFRDAKDIAPAANWDARLSEALANSQFLVVLWSQSANLSQAVQQEIAQFRLANQNKRIIYVCLDITNAFMGSIQGITDIYKGSQIGTYTMDTIPDTVFHKVSADILAAVYKEKGSTPIKRVVFTLTKPRLGELRDQGRISAAIYDAISNNYGDTCQTWKPFSGKTVVEIMDNLLYLETNKKLISGNKKNLYHWQDLDWKETAPLLWSEDDNELDNVYKDIGQLESGPCVVVLDPIVLYDELITGRLIEAYRICKDNPNSVIIITNSNLPVYPEYLSSIRSLLKKKFYTLYTDYFDTILRLEKPYAECFINIFDEQELKRNIQPLFKNAQQGASSVPYLTVNTNTI